MEREATHAGTWYKNDKILLCKELEGNLFNAKRSGVKFLIGPHAGFSYSGKTAGYCYSGVDPDLYDTVILLGPSHKVYLDTCALSQCDLYKTPLGNININREIIEDLYGTGKFQKMSLAVDSAEHSLEMHLPYIQTVMSKKSNGSFTLVPIMVGSPSVSLETEIAQELLHYYLMPNVLFIVSTDFCHWGSRFDFTACTSDAPIYKSIEELDRLGMELIKNMDLEGFRKYLKTTRNTICGRNPIQLMMNIVIRSGKVDKVFNYRM